MRRYGKRPKWKVPLTLTPFFVLDARKSTLRGQIRLGFKEVDSNNRSQGAESEGHTVGRKRHKVVRHKGQVKVRVKIDLPAGVNISSGDFRTDLIALLNQYNIGGGERNTDQTGSDYRAAFDHAVQRLQDTYNRLPPKEEVYPNNRGPMYAALIDQHGMHVDITTLNWNDIDEAIKQAKRLLGDLTAQREGLVQQVP